MRVVPRALRRGVLLALRAAHLERPVRAAMGRGAVDNLGAVPHRGLSLPPPDLRPGGSYFLDDDAFIDSGIAEAMRLKKACALSPRSRILDVGCGVGRLPIGILASMGAVRHYIGLDVGAPPIAWCQRYIERSHPGFQFRQVDVANQRYHPAGRRITRKFRFPLEDASFDIIYLYSVFSHMKAEDVAIYLREFRRLLRPEGSVFLTAFVEEGVQDVAVNPPDYIRPWKGDLHCVRFNRAFFERMVQAAGLRLEGVEHRTETDGQSALYLRPEQAAGGSLP